VENYLVRNPKLFPTNSFKSVLVGNQFETNFYSKKYILQHDLASGSQRLSEIRPQGRKLDQRGRKSDQCWSNFRPTRSKIIGPSEIISDQHLQKRVGRKSIWDQFLF
jgi:hypothetical protein